MGKKNREVPEASPMPETEPQATENGTAEAVPVAKPVESKGQKFSRLATRRVVKAIKIMRALANLGNRNNYEYTQDQAKKLLGVVAKEVDNIERAFTGTVKETEEIMF